MIDPSTSLPAFSVLVVGFTLGIRHATEADHLAAVSTMIEEPGSALKSSLIGGLWGIGHTFSLLVVGLAVIFLQVEISATTEARLESLVGAMLILLGLNVLWKISRGMQFHAHIHEHRGRLHAHVHRHDPAEPAEPHHKFSWRSVLVGMIHGLAGSAALMLLVLPVIGSRAVAVGYILVFGLGSIAGMMLMSCLIGIPMHLAQGRGGVIREIVRVCSAIVSVALGGWMIIAKMGPNL